MGIARPVGRTIGAFAVAITGVNVAAAAIATKTDLAAKVFGPGDGDRRYPADIGLAAVDVEYRPGSRAWWIPAAGAIGSVVIVHGFDPSDDPRSADHAPRLEVARMLASHSFSSLVVNLGYASGSRPHTGGVLEAADVADAAAFARREGGQPVALFGFSAGGHACVAAASTCRPFAVVTDGAFADYGAVVIEQTAKLTKLPSSMLSLVPAIMGRMTGHRPGHLRDFVDGSAPMLHIHSTADTAIDFGKLNELRSITGGETLVIDGADHNDGFRVDPDRYELAAVDFLTRSLPR